MLPPPLPLIITFDAYQEGNKSLRGEMSLNWCRDEQTRLKHTAGKTRHLVEDR